MIAVHVQFKINGFMQLESSENWVVLRGGVEVLIASRFLTVYLYPVIVMIVRFSD